MPVITQTDFYVVGCSDVMCAPSAVASLSWMCQFICSISRQTRPHPFQKQEVHALAVLLTVNAAMNAKKSIQRMRCTPRTIQPWRPSSLDFYLRVVDAPAEEINFCFGPGCEEESTGDCQQCGVPFCGKHARPCRYCARFLCRYCIEFGRHLCREPPRR